MIKTELHNRSPLRILEKSIHGGLGKGNIGIISARKGVGKTACLVHIATDQLLNGKHIIHVSFSADTNHIISWYEDIYKKISKRRGISNVEELQNEIIKNRIIMNFNQDGVKMTQVIKSVRSMIIDGQFSADIIIIDGYKITGTSKEELTELKALAKEIKLEIWFSITLDDDLQHLNNRGVPVSLIKTIDEISILLLLRPQHDYIHIELIKDHNIYPDSDLSLKLDPVTLLIQET